MEETTPMEVKFAFSIGDEVRINAINTVGRVVALMLDCQGPSYSIAYWNDGQRYSAWLFDWEISGVKPC